MFFPEGALACPAPGPWQDSQVFAAVCAPVRRVHGDDAQEPVNRVDRHVADKRDAQQIAVVSYSALASGFLTGKYRTPADAKKSARGAGVVSKFLNERGLRILAALDAVARRYAVTPATVALAWQIARPSITAPIASATTQEQLSELVNATQLTLDQAAIEQLNAASS